MTKAVVDTEVGLPPTATPLIGCSPVIAEAAAEVIK